MRVRSGRTDGNVNHPCDSWVESSPIQVVGIDGRPRLNPRRTIGLPLPHLPGCMYIAQRHTPETCRSTQTHAAVCVRALCNMVRYVRGHLGKEHSCKPTRVPNISGREQLFI